MQQEVGQVYQSVVASAPVYAVVWRGGSTNTQNKPIKQAGCLIGCKLDIMEAVAERRTLSKPLSVLDNPEQPLLLLLTQTDSAPLPQGQIQEIFSAQCNNLVQQLHLTETYSPSCSEMLDLVL